MVDLDGIVAEAQAIGAGLDSAFQNAGAPSQYQGSIDAWHGSEEYWESLADRAASDANVLTEWTRIGGNIGATGRDLAQQLADTSLAARAEHFVATLPASVAQVASGALAATKNAAVAVVDAAGGVAKQAAWSLAPVVIVLGAAAALVLYLVSRSGARVHAGPLSVG